MEGSEQRSDGIDLFSRPPWRMCVEDGLGEGGDKESSTAAVPLEGMKLGWMG